MLKFDFDFDENDNGTSAVSGSTGPSTSETVNHNPTVLEPFCEIPLSNLVCSTFLYS
jgi:hypothetical protein